MTKYNNKSNVKVRTYSPRSDTRRYSDGLRLHEYLGYILMEGGNHLMQRYPNHQISRADFSRSALPVLEKLGLVELINPLDQLPAGLGDRERKLAMRSGKKPIWMPTQKMPVYVWNDVVSEIWNGSIVWPAYNQ